MLTPHAHTDDLSPKKCTFPQVRGATIQGKYLTHLDPENNEADAFLFVLWVVSCPHFDELFPKELDQEIYKAHHRISEGKWRKSLWLGINRSYISRAPIDPRNKDIETDFHHIITQKTIGIFLQRVYNKQLGDDRELYVARAKRLQTHPLNVVPVTKKENQERGSQCSPNEIIDELQHIQNLYRKRHLERIQWMWKNKISGRDVGDFSEPSIRGPRSIQVDPQDAKKLEPFLHLLRNPVPQKSNFYALTVDSIDPIKHCPTDVCPDDFVCIRVELFSEKREDINHLGQTYIGTYAHGHTEVHIPLGNVQIENENSPYYTLFFLLPKDTTGLHCLELVEAFDDQHGQNKQRTKLVHLLPKWMQHHVHEILSIRNSSHVRSRHRLKKSDPRVKKHVFDPENMDS